ncbi:MAG TPA: type I phosphomannose isomerase catalytic subunit [Planctomycetota bacterium]|nr:type I phosphomannose isomerase catalytic subunit [Planctomycetota bacterium]
MPERPPPVYPLRFKEVFKEKIWGGPELAKVAAKKGAGRRCGESWEIAQRDGGMSVVANGPYKGWNLERLLHEHAKSVLGDEHSMRFKRYPLLVKFICAHERLSLQVHPTDDYAQRYEAEGVGKMEAWYVISAPKESRVIRGVLPGTTVAEFKEHLKNGKIEQCLNVMDIKERDVIFIPPGTIHSAYGGAVFLEVQQNSDTTYRLTDWGRVDFKGKPRALDVEKAMNVTDFYSMGVSKYKPSRIPGYAYRRKLLIKCEKFTMETIELGRQRITEKANAARSVVHTFIQGKGKYQFGENKKSSQPFKKGESYLIPAKIGEYDIVSQGSTEIVVSYAE